MLLQVPPPPPPPTNDANPIINSCGSFGWTKVAYLNMSDPVLPVQVTGLLTVHQGGVVEQVHFFYACDSTIFPVGDLTYSSVCGRILAYQKGLTDAFRNPFFGFTTIDSAYVDGISVTHGPVGSRQHIWTFAAVSMRKTLYIKPVGTVPVLTLGITGHISCLHSFRITTSVILEILDLASVSLPIILQILSGMEKVVGITIVAVNSTILYGSRPLYLRKLRMTLN